MSPTTVAAATDTERVRRIADMSHLSRGRAVAVSPRWITLTSEVAHVTIESDAAVETSVFSIGMDP
jgi:hypothetical protein